MLNAKKGSTHPLDQSSALTLNLVTMPLMTAEPKSLALATRSPQAEQSESVPLASRVTLTKVQGRVSTASQER